jgi:hypothetical protein
MQQTIRPDWVLPLGLVFAAATMASEPAGEPTELDPLTVTPPYLYESDRQLVRVARTLPDLGEPGATGLLAQLSTFFAERGDPNQLAPLKQEMLLKTLGLDDH